MNKIKSHAIAFGGALALVCALTPPCRAQRYSDWSEPVNLGPTINSVFNDSGAAISKDGLSLYFTSDRPGGFGGNDIWVSQRARLDDPWGPPMNLGASVNTSFNDANPDFSRDGHLMFLTSTRSGGLGNFDIWVSRREHTHDDFAWQRPENLGTAVNSAAADAGPNYFENDEMGAPQLYLTSNRPGGPGGFDIYVSEQNADGSFGQAMLVPELNCPMSEGGPSIRHDGLEIFIDSNRVGSAGSLDLWVSTRETVLDNWSEPANLGATVNGEFTDQQPEISSDRKTLLFTSNRPGGFGGQDLYVSTRMKLT